MKSWTRPTDKMIEKALSSVKKETDRQYFFSKLNNPLWLEPLKERGYFDSPPSMKRLPDGYLQYPPWPELTYLVNVAKDAADRVIDIVLALPKTDNIRVYDDILTIACKLKGKESAKLLPKILEYVELENQFLAHQYPDLLQHWVAEGNVDEAVEIIKRLIPFRKDPKASEKQQLRKKNPEAFGTLLEPTPRFPQWEYQQILEKGVRPLSERAPYEVARVLMDAVEDMIHKGVQPEDLEKRQGEDFSDFWCRRLDKQSNNYLDSNECLVHSLNYACEQTYKQAPQLIGELDEALRAHKWKVFNRLRQSLYGSYPNEQTLPWIRELILEHKDYSKWEYHYEFQLMIRKASEKFGSRLVSEHERSKIFEAILSGPPEDIFRERMGEDFDEEKFKQRQRYFHRLQLRPFASLLSRKLKQYYNELEREIAPKVVTDDDYAPFKISSGGFVSYRSPKSSEDLERFTDKEILAYLNEWNDQYRDDENWLIETNISALADVFQSLFKEKIIPSSERLDFWIKNREDISRPIYLAAMVRAMQETIKDKTFENLDRWIEFGAWVLSHPESAPVDGQPVPQDHSNEYPDWRSSRRAVVDLIGTCVSDDVNVPIAARSGLAGLLRLACSQFDWRLDHDRPVLLNYEDPVTEAINNTRSIALERLIDFGFWVRRHHQNDPQPEVKELLSKRITGDAEFPLTQPEHAILGMQFGNICALDRDWAYENHGIIFPKGNLPVWRDAFGSYLQYNRPISTMFEILWEEFTFALDNLEFLAGDKGGPKGLISRLGKHLFAYYLWGSYPLKGEESLLERFYEETSADHQHWVRLFDHVGRALSDSGKDLDRGLVDRAVEFFDWRYEIAEVLELQEFAYWMEAKCLDPEWRLRSYAKILDLFDQRGEKLHDSGPYLEVKALGKLLPSHLPLVVECFAKLTNILDQDSQIYMSVKEAGPILRAGLESEDVLVRSNAERARDNLLRLGRFDYLELE